MSAFIGDLMAVADEAYGDDGKKRKRRKRAKGKKKANAGGGGEKRKSRKNAFGVSGEAGGDRDPSARKGSGSRDDKGVGDGESGGSDESGRTSKSGFPSTGSGQALTRPPVGFGMTSGETKFPPKLMGELWELDFLRKTLGMGMMVSKPWGDSYRYDFVVDTGGSLWRVQVRATETRLGARGYAVHASVIVGKKIVGLTKKDIDVIVGYIAHRDIWYVVPVEAFVPRKNLWFYPDGSKKGAMFEKFRDAWWVMTGRKRRLGAGR